jgi:hypothetical protein
MQEQGEEQQRSHEIAEGHRARPTNLPRNSQGQLAPTGTQERQSETLCPKPELLSLTRCQRVMTQWRKAADGRATLHQILRTVIPKLQDFRPSKQCKKNHAESTTKSGRFSSEECDDTDFEDLNRISPLL